MVAKYGEKAQKSVNSAVKKEKKETLKSGQSGKKVTSRKQAIAIGLSEARKTGAKSPKKSSPPPPTTSQRKRASSSNRTSA